MDILAVDPSPLSAGMYWVSQHALVPTADDPGYVDAFERHVHDFRPHVVLVGTDVELAVLASRRKDLEERYGTHIVVASPNAVAIADDKYKTYCFLRANGLPAPASALPGQHQELVAQSGFPLVVKPRVGARSVGVHVVNDQRELAQALERTTDPLIQECVGTERDEYTAGTLTFDGTCHAVIVMRRDLRDGNTYRAYADRFPALESQVRPLAASFGAYGPANFQFRVDDGVVKVFEINARFSGTTPLRMLAGFNEVEMVLQHLLCSEPIRQPDIQKMTILRHWSETVVRPNLEVRW